MTGFADDVRATDEGFVSVEFVAKSACFVPAESELPAGFVSVAAARISGFVLATVAQS